MQKAFVPRHRSPTKKHAVSATIWIFSKIDRVITFSARFATGVWPRGRHVTLDHRSFQTTGRVYVNIVSFFPRQHGVWPCLADDLILSCRPLKRHYCFVCFFRQLMMKVYIIMCKSFGHYTATPNDSLRGNMIQTVKLPSKMTSGAWDGCLEINDGFMEAVSWPILNCNVLQWESSYCYKVLQITDSSILHRVTITMQSKAAVKKQFKYCLKIQIGKSQSWSRRREEGQFIRGI